ncbi:hypothetical protein TCAL_11911 [Tigriopus californicus]|uniref:Uncharacterized protein n=1 Tax=Tigriopus californicus TaxID=6832 RepID=A0A553PPS0_TIGCA|nr:hypothetical protein TCAL_11911 [Tigriopus californicus]
MSTTFLFQSEGLHNAGVQIQGWDKVLGGAKSSKQVKFYDESDGIDNTPNDGNGNPIGPIDEPSVEDLELIAKLEQANLALVSDGKAVGTVELQPDSTSSSSSANSPIKSNTEISRDGSYTSFKSDESYATDPRESVESNEFDPPIKPLDEGQRSRFSRFTANPVSKPILAGKFKSLFGKPDETVVTPPSAPPTESNFNPSTTIFRLKSIFRKTDEPVYDLEVSKTSQGQLSSDLDSFELHEAECSVQELNVPVEIQPEVVKNRVHEDEKPIELEVDSVPKVKSSSDLIQEFAFTVNYQVDEQEVQFVTKFNPDEIESCQTIPLPEPALVQLIDLEPYLEQKPQLDQLCHEGFVHCEVEELIELVPPPIELDRISSESETESIVVLRDPKESVPVVPKPRLAQSSPKRTSFNVSDLNLFRRVSASAEPHDCSIGNENELQDDFIVTDLNLSHHNSVGSNLDADTCSILDENEPGNALEDIEREAESDTDDFKLLEEEAEKLQKAIEAKAKTLALESTSEPEQELDKEVLPQVPVPPSLKHTPQSAFRISRSFSGSQTSLKKESFDLGTWPRKNKTLKPEPPNLKPSVSTSSLFDQLNQESAPKRKQSFKKLFVRKAKERSHSLKRSFRSLRGKNKDKEETLKTPQQAFEQEHFADFDDGGTLRSSHSLSSVSLPIHEEQSESEPNRPDTDDIQDDSEVSPTFQVIGGQEQPSSSPGTQQVEQVSSSTEEDSESPCKSEEGQTLENSNDIEKATNEFKDFPSKQQWEHDWAVKFENSFDQDFFGAKAQVSLESDQESIGSDHSADQGSPIQNLEDAFKPQNPDLEKADRDSLESSHPKDEVSFNDNFGDSFDPGKVDRDSLESFRPEDKDKFNPTFGDSFEQEKADKDSLESLHLEDKARFNANFGKPFEPERVDFEKNETTGLDQSVHGSTDSLNVQYQNKSREKCQDSSDPEKLDSDQSLPPSSDDNHEGSKRKSSGSLDTFNFEDQEGHPTSGFEDPFLLHTTSESGRGQVSTTFEDAFHVPAQLKGRRDNSQDISKTEEEFTSVEQSNPKRAFDDAFEPENDLTQENRTNQCETESSESDLSRQEDKEQSIFETAFETAFQSGHVGNKAKGEFDAKVEEFEETEFPPYTDFEKKSTNLGEDSTDHKKAIEESKYSTFDSTKEDLKDFETPTTSGVGVQNEDSQTDANDKDVIVEDRIHGLVDYLPETQPKQERDAEPLNNQTIQENLRIDEEITDGIEPVHSFNKSPRPRVARSHSREPSDSGDSFHKFEAYFQGDGISIDSDPFKEDPFANDVVRDLQDPQEPHYSGNKPRLSLEPVREEESIDLSDKEAKKTGTKPKDPLPVSSVPERNTKTRASRQYDIETSTSSDSEPEIRAKPRRRAHLSHRQSNEDDRLHVPKAQSVLKLRSRSGTGSSSSESGSLRNSLEPQLVKDKKITFKKAVKGIAKAVSLQDISLSKSKVTDKRFKWFKRKSIGEVPEQSVLQEEIAKQNQLGLTDSQLWELWKNGKDVQFKVGKSQFYVPSPRRIEIFEKSEEIEITEEALRGNKDQRDIDSSRFASPDKSSNSEADPKSKGHPAAKDSFEDNFNAEFEDNFDNFTAEERLDQPHQEEKEEKPQVQEAQELCEDQRYATSIDLVKDPKNPENKVEEEIERITKEEVQSDIQVTSIETHQNTDEETDINKSEDVFKDCESFSDPSDSDDPDQFLSIQTSPVKEGVVLKNFASPSSQPRVQPHSDGYSSSSSVQSDVVFIPKAKARSNSLETAQARKAFKTATNEPFPDLNPDLQESSSSITTEDSDTFYSLSSEVEGKVVRFSNPDISNTGFLSEDDEDTLQSNSSSSEDQPKYKMNHAQGRSRHSMVDYYNHHHEDKSSPKRQLKSRSKSASPLKRLKNLFKGGQPAPAVVKFHENPLDPKRLNHNPIFLEDEMQDNSEYDPSKEQYRPRSGVADPLIDEDPHKTPSGRQPVARGKRTPKARLLATR